MSEPASPEVVNHLSEDIFTDYLRAVSGGRNIALLISLDDFSYKTGHEVQREWEGTSTFDIARGYCRNQLKQMPGTVIQAGESNEDIPDYFSITDEGRKARAFGAHIAKLCFDYQIAPFDLVGPRNTPRSAEGLEPFFSRLAIYGGLLLTEDQAPITPELLTQTTYNGHFLVPSRIVHNHLPSLFRTNIVEPINDGTLSTYPEYQASATPPEEDLSEVIKDSDASSWRPRTKDLVHAVLEQVHDAESRIGVESIRQKLKANGSLPELVRSKTKAKQNEAIARTLDLLSTRGYVDQAKPGIEKVSHINLTSQGREIIGRYFDLCAQVIVDGNSLVPTGQRISDEFLSYPSRFGWLLNIDFDTGAIAKRKSMEERKDEIASLLAQSSGGITMNAIMEATGMKRRALHTTLQNMQDEGTIISEQHGRVHLHKLL